MEQLAFLQSPLVWSLSFLGIVLCLLHSLQRRKTTEVALANLSSIHIQPTIANLLPVEFKTPYSYREIRASLSRRCVL